MQTEIVSVLHRYTFQPPGRLLACADEPKSGDLMYMYPNVWHVLQPYLSLHCFGISLHCFVYSDFISLLGAKSLEFAGTGIAKYTIQAADTCRN